MMGLNRRVGSIREAIILAGRKTIRDMSLLIAMARLASSMPELMVNAMVRARTCELLAGTYRMGASADVAFTVGLFSMLDVILGVEMPVLLAEMALGEEVEQAILERTGSYGEALQCALMLETGELTALLPGAIRWNEAVELYLDALEWADNSRHVLN
jgi:EAL and modified HD-GYP domain-containing signal transduction protein